MAQPVSNFIQQDAGSASTLPLLNYFLKTGPNTSTTEALQVFERVKEGVGKDEPPLDESEQLRGPYLDMIDFGVGHGKKITGSPKVTIVGAGISGLCAGYELKKAGFEVTILEASSRIGGRVKTFHDPTFAPGLHGEGGAMRIPSNHFLLHRYIEHFGLSSNLFDFQMENFFIYMSGYEKTLTYEKFNKLLKGEGSKEDVDRLRALFPHLKSDEKNKTVDELFTEATNEVVKAWRSTYEAEKKNNGSEAFAIKKAYEVITKTYDKYTLRSYLVEHKNWSQDAINLFDLGNAHVVFENGFIESFKDAFLSSNKQGGQAGMQQLKQGMDAVPKAFISTDRGDASLIDNIVYGARVSAIEDLQPKDEVHIIPGKVRTHFTGLVGKPESIDSDYIILAIPYTSQRSISKNRSFVPKQEMAIRDVRYVEVTKVLLQYKTRWWEDAFEKGTGGKSPDGGLVSDLPIRYTMFPKRDGNPQFDHSKRGVIMAAYTFQQDATILGALSPERRIRLAAENLDRIYPEAKSLDLLEAGTSQVFPADELAGGSAFCYFGPTQKQDYLETMCRSDWEDRVFFAGEQASYTHGWIQGALEAGLRCAQQIWRTATVQPQ